MNHPILTTFAIVGLAVVLLWRWLDRTNVADPSKYIGNDWRNGRKTK